MRKIVALFCALICCLSLIACGKTMCTATGCDNEAVEDLTFGEPLCNKHFALKKAFSSSKEAYGHIEKAYEIADKFGSDIYEAWRLGIYDDDEIMEDGTKHLAKELSLTESQLNLGLAYAIEVVVMGNEWSSVTQETKDSYAKSSSLYFSIFEDSLFSLCVEVVNGAYEVSGEVEIAQSELEAAKKIMKELSENYSDYEHYPNLKGYYTTTSSFFDFCKEPSGSFEQIKNTINDYRNDARDYISDLDYIFEE